MKLINTISSLLLEYRKPWHEKVFQSKEIDEIRPLIKLFGGDIHEIYNALDKIGLGEGFVNHIYYFWPPDEHRYIIDVLGGRKKWELGMVDNDLMDEYVIQPYLQSLGDIETKDGRIILELMSDEKAYLFEVGHCRHIAEQIFSEEGLEWEPYSVTEKLEDLIRGLSPENYIKLVRHIGIEFQNEEVDAWREEFDNVREDNGKVIITPEFMNAYLPGDEGDRYNLAVLIGNTPELDEVEGELNNAYSSAWNHVVWDQYYQEYNDAFHDFLGKPIGHGTTYTYPKHGTDASSSQYKKVEVPVEYFDVTELIMPLIVRHVEEIDNPENFLTMLNEFDMDTLCPNVQDYPYNTEDVNNLFQEYLWDYL